MEITFSQLFLILIAFQSVSLSAYLIFQSEGKRSSNTFLAIFLLLLGTQFGVDIYDLMNATQFARWSIPIRFLYGPLIYFYVKSLAEAEYEIKFFDAIHFVPFVLVLALFWFGVNPDSPIIVAGMQLNIVAYLIASVSILRSYRKIIEETRSDVDRVSFTWMKNLVVYLSLVILLDIFQQSFAPYLSYFISEIIYGGQMLLLVLMINTLVFKGLKHPSIFQGITEADKKVVKEKNDKYKSSKLSKSDLKKYETTISDLMAEEKLYLNPELSLQQLADKIGLNIRDTSYVINHQFGSNYSELVNKFRIHEAARIIQNKEDKTISEIMYEVGYNSKSSFYSAFKKVKGMSPKEFQGMV